MAGEDVLYAPAPGWVVPADTAKALDWKGELPLVDRQRLLDDGTVHAYEDMAIRLATPDAVTKMNTLSLSWLPDKGDLTVHGVQIIRGNEVIDVLGDGLRFTVLRRETGLEKQEVDGALTATLPVPGLRVGDIIRITKSTTVKDQAFPNDVQLVDALVALPIPIGFGREVVSWPSGQQMKWRTTGDAAVETAEAAGLTRLSIDLPVAEAKEMPADAPLRYRMPPLLQVTSFTSWRDVSATMAPFFATEGTIDPAGPIAREVARIEQAADSPLERAALALQLVQDQISYLANGMDGGNYIPQQPKETWASRYGDCKAKSLLLAAILREMDIPADIVLVSTEAGDAAPSLLPQPSDFNHVIVRSRIDGADYWLDGTTAGTRMATLGEVPNFEHALPLVAGGADLAVIEQRWQPAPDRVLHLTYDMTAGFDLPVIYTADIELSGSLAAQVRVQAADKSEKNRREFVDEYMSKLFNDSLLIEGTVTYDEARGQAFIHAVGEYSNDWPVENGKATFEPVLESTNLEFSPDRGRAAWQSIPVQLGGPIRYREETTILLPDSGADFRFRGLQAFSDVVAGRKIERKVTVKPDRIEIVDDISTIPVEIAPDSFAAERAKVASFDSGDPVIETSAEKFYWTLDAATFRARTRKLEEAYAKVLGRTSDEAWIWSRRGDLRSRGPDKAGALADMTKALELDASGNRYLARSLLFSDMGRDAEALADAREAYALAPNTDNAIFLAMVLAENAAFDEALGVLDDIDSSGDDRMRAMLAQATIAGEAHRLDEGWAWLEQALAERPGSGEVLNGQCWYAGTWKYRLEEAAEICTKAVQASQWSPDTLYSRALAYYRLGKTDAALADLDAALRSAPLQAGSRYLRGIIKFEAGSPGARADIEDALRLAPSIKYRYQRYGISTPK